MVSKVKNFLSIKFSKSIRQKIIKTALKCGESTHLGGAFSQQKRVFDLLLALSMLVILLPVMQIVSSLILIKMGRPIIFKQDRPGLHGKLFKMYKFRTMLSPETHRDLSDAERVTPLGRFLRSTSLDELPELFNVVKGDMSLIGPRPLLVEYLNKYSNYQMQRHDTLPGITGLAQVQGRNSLSWKNKFRYDVFYKRNMCWKLDLSIFFKTIKIVILRKDFKLSGEENKFNG